MNEVAPDPINKKPNNTACLENKKHNKSKLSLFSTYLFVFGLVLYLISIAIFLFFPNHLGDDFTKALMPIASISFIVGIILFFISPVDSNTRELGLPKEQQSAQITRKAIILAFIPLTGPFGVHDSMVGRIKQSVHHKFLALTILFVPIFGFASLLILGWGGSGYARKDPISTIMATTTMVLPFVLFNASYVWSIYEGCIFHGALKGKAVKSTKKSALIVASLVAALLIVIPLVFIYSLALVGYTEY